MEYVHGIIYSDPQQTPCGLSTTGHNTTDDPFKVTCPDCARILKMTDDLPGGPVAKRGRGRPRKERVR